VRISRQVAIALMTVTVLLAAVAGAVSASAAGSPARLRPTTTTVRYGPYTVPAASSMEMGMLTNKLQLDVAEACNACYITGIAPDLVYADGSAANVNTGAWLHHMVWFDWGLGRVDATRGTSALGLLGERFFATGNERTRFTLPAGFGYRVGLLDVWNAVTDLMNMNPHSITVYVTFKVTHVPATAAVIPVRPVWFDINQCGNSEYSIPAGFSDTTWTWKANVPGTVVAIGGHVHDSGTNIYAVDRTTGALLCDSRASYGTLPAYIDMDGMAHLSHMTTCSGTQVTKSTMATRSLSTATTSRPHRRTE
jgi:hypothetical protein